MLLIISTEEFPAPNFRLSYKTVRTLVYNYM